MAPPTKHAHGPAHLAVARAEYAALDDAALLLRPGAAVWVQAAGFRGAAHVWAGGSFLPAIAKVQLTAHHHVIPCGEVIAGAVIEVPTQATNGALWGDKHPQAWKMAPGKEGEAEGLSHVHLGKPRWACAGGQPWRGLAGGGGAAHLVGGSQLNEDGGLFVPDDNNASAGLHH